MNFETRAPANIALIKYMGKTDSNLNQPVNSSLSYTLPCFETIVRLEVQSELESDTWQALESSTKVSVAGQQKFLRHLGRLKQEFGISKNLKVLSANTFPADCGLASSASSFAALTKAFFTALPQLNDQPDEEDLQIKPSEVSWRQQARYAQLGSGSSCRSFCGPWALWSAQAGEDPVRAIEFPQGKLLHHVVVVHDAVKAVSSSEAHKRVASSPLFVGRQARAEKRLQDLLQAFQQEDWREAFHICWEEFMDMHALFETSDPSFSYMSPETHEVLSDVRGLWEQQGDGPLVTMDAGPNVHLLYRRDQAELAKQVAEKLSKRYPILWGATEDEA